MSDIQVFQNERFGEVRAISQNGEPWFVAKDVCNALDLSNVGQALVALDEDEKGSIIISDGTPGNPTKAIVSEPGFYKLVMRSRKPEAKAFQRWVTHEVLPALRAKGTYTAPMTREQRVRAALAESNAIIVELDGENRALKAENAELRPKALFADAVAASDGTCLVGELAKMMRQNGVEIGQNRLFERLRADGYLGNVGSNKNVPTQRAMDMGLFRIKETVVVHSDGHQTTSRTPKVTGKGQQYFMGRYGGGSKQLTCA